MSPLIQSFSSPTRLHASVALAVLSVILVGSCAGRPVDGHSHDGSGGGQGDADLPPDAPPAPGVVCMTRQICISDAACDGDPISFHVDICHMVDSVAECLAVTAPFSTCADDGYRWECAITDRLITDDASCDAALARTDPYEPVVGSASCTSGDTLACPDAGHAVMCLDGEYTSVECHNACELFGYDTSVGCSDVDSKCHCLNAGPPCDSNGIGNMMCRTTSDPSRPDLLVCRPGLAFGTDDPMWGVINCQDACVEAGWDATVGCGPGAGGGAPVCYCEYNCQGCSAGQVCNHGTGACEAAPTDECTYDSSCGYSEACIAGVCQYVDCTTDSHCPSCSRCVNHYCSYCGSGPYGCYCG